MVRLPGRILFAAAVVSCLGACGTQGADFWERQAQNDGALDSRSIREVVQQDLQDLTEVPDVRTSAHPQLINAFGQVFGGYDGRAVRQFVDARLKHYLTPEDQAALDKDVATWKYDRWAAGGDEARALAAASSESRAESRSRAAAQNIGAYLWMMGAVNESPATLYYRGKRVLLTSSRAGVMLTGESYINSRFDDDVYHAHGPIERQMVLVHEARHSDCTGGLYEADLRLARSAKSHEEYLAKAKNLKCSHLHVACKSGPLEGVLACDAEPWGSYSVGLVYLEAAVDRLDPFSPEAVMARASIIDLRSRLEFSADDMLSGRMGSPDMTHSDERVP